MKIRNKLLFAIFLVGMVVMLSAPAIHDFDLPNSIACLLMGFVCLVALILVAGADLGKILGCCLMIITFNSCTDYSGHFQSKAQYDSAVNGTTRPDSAKYRVKSLTLIRYAPNEYTMVPVNNTAIIMLPIGYMPNDTIFDPRMTTAPDNEVFHYLVVISPVKRQ